MPVGDGWQLFVEEPTGGFQKVELTREQAMACETLTQDGGGTATAVLAGLWTAWMEAATAGGTVRYVDMSPSESAWRDLGLAVSNRSGRTASAAVRP
jgi:hypothetical protein